MLWYQAASGEPEPLPPNRSLRAELNSCAVLPEAEDEDEDATLDMDPAEGGGESCADASEEEEGCPKWWACCRLLKVCRGPCCCSWDGWE